MRLQHNGSAQTHDYGDRHAVQEQAGMAEGSPSGRWQQVLPQERARLASEKSQRALG